MKDTFEFTLNNPLTEEQWDMITDVDFDRTDRITFHTKHGKEVKFTKVIRCKDCKFNPKRIVLGCPMAGSMSRNDDSFCSVGKRRKTRDDGSLCAFPKDEMVDDDG